MHIAEYVGVFLVVAGVVGYFVSAATGWDIPSRELLSAGLALLGGTWAGIYVGRKGDY
jgi:uncharacterized protein YneF (UPF0154 family)